MFPLRSLLSRFAAHGKPIKTEPAQIVGGLEKMRFLEGGGIQPERPASGPVPLSPKVASGIPKALIMEVNRFAMGTPP